MMSFVEQIVHYEIMEPNQFRHIFELIVMNRGRFILGGGKLRYESLFQKNSYLITKRK